MCENLRNETDSFHAHFLITVTLIPRNIRERGTKVYSRENKILDEDF